MACKASNIFLTGAFLIDYNHFFTCGLTRTSLFLILLFGVPVLIFYAYGAPWWCPAIISLQGSDLDHVKILLGLP